MDRFTAMEVFIRAADTGSFTAAALSPDMSPQMVGTYVASLEQRLGTRLLQRTTQADAPPFRSASRRANLTTSSRGLAPVRTSRRAANSA